MSCKATAHFLCEASERVQARAGIVVAPCPRDYHSSPVIFLTTPRRRATDRVPAERVLGPPPRGLLQRPSPSDRPAPKYMASLPPATATARDRARAQHGVAAPRRPRAGCSLPSSSASARRSRVFLGTLAAYTRLLRFACRSRTPHVLSCRRAHAPSRSRFPSTSFTARWG